MQFQLFKERNFSDYINDTFQFFKIHGKHFFKTFFTVNGIPLLIATVLVYFFSKIYMDFIFTNISNPDGNRPEDAFGNFFNENFGLIIVLAILAFIVLVTISIFQFSFPVVYLDLLDSKKGTDFTAKDIFQGMKKRISRILKFFLGAFFVLFPLMMIVMIINVLLCFIIIGIPLLFVMFPAMLSFVQLTFFYYMNSDQGFFTAISDAYDTVKNQLWPIVGTTAVMMIIIQIVSTIFTMIPYVFGMASMFTTLESGDSEEAFSIISMMMSIVMVISIIVSFIFNNLLLVNQGMIYYSHIENSESSFYVDSLDLIGTDSE